MRVLFCCLQYVSPGRESSSRATEKYEIKLDFNLTPFLLFSMFILWDLPNWDDRVRAERKFSCKFASLIFHFSCLSSFSLAFFLSVCLCKQSTLIAQSILVARENPKNLCKIKRRLTFELHKDDTTYMCVQENEMTMPFRLTCHVKSSIYDKLMAIFSSHENFLLLRQWGESKLKLIHWDGERRGWMRWKMKMPTR